MMWICASSGSVAIVGRSRFDRQGGSDRTLGKVDLFVKLICRNLGEVDLGVIVDLIASLAK